MTATPISADPSSRLTTHVSARRDIAIVAVTTLAAWALSAIFQWSEIFYELTRHWEELQLDELPVALLVLTVGLSWLAWRRYRQALLQLQARQAAEAKLSEALAENRKFAQQHLQIQEAERKHLARELHDELGQYLNAIKIDAVSIQFGAFRNSEASNEAAARIIRATDHIHGVVSDMIRRLRPSGLDELGLVAALENCIDQWRQRVPKTAFNFTTHGLFDNLGETLDLTLYRLIQEGLTNSCKYAAAEHVDVALRRDDAPNEAWLVLTVSDDGRGADKDRVSSGFGLRGMRERVEMMGGEFRIDNGPGGFSFEARLPLRSAT